MILLDSSVIINFLNNNEHAQTLQKLIQEQKIIVTDIVIMEVLQGAKNDSFYEKIKRFLDSLPRISASYNDYIFASNIYRECRKNGKTIRKSIDCLIGAIAMHNDLVLFSNDRDFFHIQECFELKLYI
ncbi:MAG: PIN domain nuclease [Campylobacterales bacterium]|nr:PIN domain nuclease [Campylobacterales bacterium]